MNNPLLPPLVILLSIAVYGAVHSWLASLTAKRQAQRRLGEAYERFYRIGYNVFAVVSLAPTLALAALLPDRRIYAIPSPWLLLALAGQALGALMLAIGVLQTGAARFLGIRQLFDRQPDRPGGLVLDGLYRWVRHPLYTAGMLILWLTPVMTVNILALNIGFTIYLIVGALFEERKLEHEFGAAYREYRQRTPMFFPRRIR